MTYANMVNAIMRSRNLDKEPAPLWRWGFSMMRTATLLAKKILEEKTLCVWGDYDVDGVTATAIMLKGIRELRECNFLSGDICWHIPDRFSEGYGMNSGFMPAIARQSRCLVSVDCGISSHEAIARAKELGIEVIITDHHLPQKTLPDADAIFNPTLSNNPDFRLAGCGVAYLILCAVCEDFRARGLKTPDMTPYLDLVALGSIADRAPMNGQNRILVKKGLELLNEAPSPGIAALMEVSGCALVNTKAVEFALAPRINAAGRMAHADIALDLLLTDDPVKAREIAWTLQKLNRKRKVTERWMSEEAIAQANEQIKRHPHGLVLHDAAWHPGIVGIVASRIVETFNVPALVACNDGQGNIKGSGRSLAEVNLYMAMNDCKDCFTGFGGHPMAAGFKCRPEALEGLREAFSENCLARHNPANALPIDGSYSIFDVTLPDLRMTEYEPYGEGNLPPRLCSENLVLIGLEKKGQQAVLTLADREGRMKTVKCRDIRLEKKDLGRTLKLVYTPEQSNFMGCVNMDIQAVGWEYGSKKESSVQALSDLPHP